MTKIHTIYYDDKFIHEFSKIIKESKKKKDKAQEKTKKLIREILEISTKFAFTGNLWKSYIAYLLISDENPYTLTVERRDLGSGSSRYLVMDDLEIFYKLFNYDFKKLEKDLGLNHFSLISSYESLDKPRDSYNRDIAKKIDDLYHSLDKASNLEEFYKIINKFYKEYGVGIYALNKAFRLDKDSKIIPITNLDQVSYDHIIAYESQKKEIAQNTQAFVEGKPANNVLLYGDSGTGKSTTIKATLNEFFHQGLRMIEIYKHQLENLSEVITSFKHRNYKFILYMDDLSFEEFETDYKYLKSIIEGSLENKPRNILVYATSNRRNLIKETWADKADMEIDGDMRRSDNQEEKQSLARRFGISIQFLKPDQEEYLEIVKAMARDINLDIDEEELIKEAKIWERWNGGKSGRTAEQFIRHLQSKL